MTQPPQLLAHLVLMPLGDTARVLEYSDFLLRATEYFNRHQKWPSFSDPVTPPLYWVTVVGPEGANIRGKDGAVVRNEPKGATLPVYADGIVVQHGNVSYTNRIRITPLGADEETAPGSARYVKRLSSI